MLPPLIQRARHRTAHRTRERGVTMALVAVSLVAIIAMAALSIDIGTMYQASAEAQRAADAAALAAAREIAISGLTGDPTNGSGFWGGICGGAGSTANLTAIAVAQQNTVGGTSPPAPTITYSYLGAASSVPSCTSLVGTAFAVNPLVTVQVTQTNLPTFFAHVFGLLNSNWSAVSVGGTATAEVFNPSNSGAYSGGTLIPVQPRCVKPWMVPNQDPLHPATTCAGAGCTSFVDTGSGQILSPGVYPTGVIGERFWLMSGCDFATTCLLLAGGPPQANFTGAPAPGKPNLEYVPSQIAASPPTAIPKDGSPACANVAAASSNYAPATAGCDQSTQYQCGSTGANAVDLSENPQNPSGSGDITNGVQCLTHQGTQDTSQAWGQDVLAPGSFTQPLTAPTYPFQIQAGTSTPLTGLSGTAITSSTSIVSLPIYDSANDNITQATTVTIVGFLQVFINDVDANGLMDVTVVNVSGCSNDTTGSPIHGTSSVPVRLITPP
jgi:hypothetical protein